MEAKYEEFLSFDWSDEQWETYLKNLYPPPNPRQLLKFKKKWYAKNVDSDFDANYEPPSAASASSSSSDAIPGSRGMPNPFSGGIHNEGSRWAVMGTKATICFTAYAVALTMSVAAVAGAFPASQALMILVGAFILEILAKYGLKFSSQYLQSVLLDDVGVMPMMALTLLMPGLHNLLRLLALVSPFLTALMTFAQICKSHTRLPNWIRDFFSPLSEASARYQIMGRRADAEVILGVILVGAVFAMQAAPISALLFWNFMMMRYMMSPWTQASFRKVDGALSLVLGKIPLVRNAYAAFKRFLYSFVDPESRKAGQMCTVL
eukprot:gnl/TRDRNA2_/TRDRNA2_84963_c0_seq1.p1 gnl/TRDRNA2_/TRDRNA2_84963_c0~~gnl/TRDRNA2_/TRDRNA2_84963_c0_seq1.p1  ORF type:complete len:320 (+),score=52.49 gnl/TRDRNA2_/TRDRNA2_84963_c0_seq1:45-1004(+)